MMPDGIYHPLPTLEFERHLWKTGYTHIAGIDEAGRGAWAGPVAAAAVILADIPSLASTLKGVRDSKLMTPRSREVWAQNIKENVASWGVGFASSQEIDALGILPATKLAARRALADLCADYLLTDYLIFSEIELFQTALVKGDQRSLSVASASILAKTSRDALMREYDLIVPGYGFDRHKGYGTAFHREAIMKLGRCEIHRNSFSIP